MSLSHHWNKHEDDYSHIKKYVKLKDRLRFLFSLGQFLGLSWEGNLNNTGRPDIVRDFVFVRARQLLRIYACRMTVMLLTCLTVYFYVFICAYYIYK